MTPRERHLAFFAGEPTNRLLNQPLLMSLAVRLGGASYREAVQDGELWAALQLKAAKLGEVDVLSACSDPVRECHDLGGELEWFEDAPPAPNPDKHLLRDKDELESLPWDVTGPRMEDRLAAIRAMKREESFPVLGWVEGPSSLGAVLRGTTTLMEDFLDDEGFVEALFERCTQMAIRFAVAQIEAGADMIGMGDAPSSLIGPELYQRFVVPGEQRIVDAVHQAGAGFRLHICGNTSRLAPAMDQTGADMIDLDSPVDFGKAVGEMPTVKGILGNLDPVRDVLKGNPESIQAGLEECHQAAGPRYVAGAGCELPGATPLENVLAFSAFSKAKSSN